MLWRFGSQHATHARTHAPCRMSVRSRRGSERACHGGEATASHSSAAWLVRSRPLTCVETSSQGATITYPLVRLAVV